MVRMLLVLVVLASPARGESSFTRPLPDSLPDGRADQIRSGVGKGRPTIWLPEPFEIDHAYLRELQDAVDFTFDYQVARALLVGALVCEWTEHGDPDDAKVDDARAAAEALDRLRVLVGTDTMRAAEKIARRPRQLYCRGGSLAIPALLDLFDELAWDDAGSARELAVRAARPRFQMLLSTERIEAQLRDRRSRVLDAAKIGGKALDDAVRTSVTDGPLTLYLIDRFSTLSARESELATSLDRGPPTPRDAQRLRPWLALKELLGTELVERLTGLKRRLRSEEDERTALWQFDELGAARTRHAWLSTAAAESWRTRRQPGPELAIGVGPFERGPDEASIARLGAEAETVWSCADDSGSRLVSTCGYSRSWFRGPGRYHVAFKSDGAEHGLDFTADGTESRIEVVIPRFTRLLLKRFVPATALQLEWLSPARGGGRARLRNSGDVPLQVLGRDCAEAIEVETWLGHHWSRQFPRRQEATFELAPGSVVECSLRDTAVQVGPRSRLLARALTGEPDHDGVKTLFEVTSAETSLPPTPARDAPPPASAEIRALVIEPNRNNGTYTIDVVAGESGVFVARGRELRRVDGDTPRVAYTARAPLLGLGASQDGRRVAAVGHDVCVLSTDGGRSFRESSLPDHAAAYAVAFAGPVPFVFAADGRAWKVAEDGSFQPVVMPAAATWYSASFRDSLVGAVVGAQNVVAVTEDGGATWRVSAGPPGVEGVAWQGDALVVGALAGVFRSIDGGRSFSALARPEDGWRCDRIATRGKAILAACFRPSPRESLLYFPDGETRRELELEVSAHMIACGFGPNGWLYAVGSQDLVLGGRPEDGLDIIWAGRTGWDIAQLMSR